MASRARAPKVHTTRAQSTTDAIRQMILDGELADGQRLGAQMLADRLGVSRTPIVDALGVLHKEGLLEYGAHRGYSVRTFGAGHLLDAFDARLALEGMACRLITERGLSSDTGAALQANLEKTKAILFDGDWGPAEQEAWRVANVEFHDLILAEAGNSHLTEGVERARLLPPIIDRLDRRIDQKEVWPRLDRAFSQRAFADHVRIVEAIAAGQSTRAENMMEEHIFTSREATRRVIEALITGSD